MARWSALSFIVAANLLGCSSGGTNVNVLLPPGTPAQQDMSVARPRGGGGTAGLTVTPASGLTTTRDNTQATFRVVLAAPPADAVTVHVISGDPTQGTVSPSTLNFYVDDWNVAQAVTLSRVDNTMLDGTHSYTISIVATSNDPNYETLGPSTVSVTNTNTVVPVIVPGFVVTPTSGLTTTPGGSPAVFTVALATQPSANVTIGLSSDNTNQGTVGPASLTFTPANWSTPQMVTVSGVDDQIADGNQLFNIVFAAATSMDAAYNGLTPAKVPITNIEVDVAGIDVSPTSGLNTTKAGGTASFGVKLHSKPTATVTIALSSSNTSEGTPSPTSLAFTTVNWATSQSVTVTGVNDNKVTGNVSYSIITAPAVSTDSVYSGLNASDVSVTNIDTNVATIIVSRSSLSTTEAGGSDSFKVSLSSLPSATVTIPVSIVAGATTTGTVNTPSIVLNSGNWNTGVTVTVTGVENTVVDASTTYSVAFGTSSCSDGNYNAKNLSSITVTNADDDVDVFGMDPMVWCWNGTCNANVQVTLSLKGTANFWLANGSAGPHTVAPDVAAAWFGTSGVLVTKGSGAPFQATPVATGMFGFFCTVHGSGMHGVLNVQ